MLSNHLQQGGCLNQWAPPGKERAHTEQMGLSQLARKPLASLCWVKNGGWGKKKKPSPPKKPTHESMQHTSKESRRKGNPNVLSLAIKHSFQRVYACLAADESNMCQWLWEGSSVFRRK